jgi:hypothetical protein
VNDYCLARKAFADGREAIVHPLTYGRARISIGPAGSLWFYDSW